MPRGRPDNYQQVDERLQAFWKDHPDGRVLTDLVEPRRDGEYIVKASVWRDAIDYEPTADGDAMTLVRPLPDATGYAEEHLDPSHPVNATWPLENCETSAIGRALANLGYAPKGPRPSQTEMEKAERQSAAGPSSGSTPAADSGSGGEVGAGTAPPARTYPFDQDRCKHKDNRGRTHHSIEEDGVDRCELCGMPWVSAVEGTLDDIRRG